MERTAVAGPLSIAILLFTVLAHGVPLADAGARLAPPHLADPDLEGPEAPVVLDVDERSLPGAPATASPQVPYAAAGTVTLPDELGAAVPSGLAAGDLDGDGMPDLVASHTLGHGGFVTVHRGNVDAVFPHTPEARERRTVDPSSVIPFRPSDDLFEVGARPDFLATGDFDNDGGTDVLTATRGGRELHLLLGDGAGGLGEVRVHAIDGTITGLVAGDLNRRDGLTDLAVAVDGDAGPRVLVYEGPDGALSREPEVVPLSAVVTELRLEQIVGDGSIDIILGTGPDRTIVEGRDRRLTSSTARRAAVESARVTEMSLEPVDDGGDGLRMRLNEDAFYDRIVIEEDGTVGILLSEIQATITVDSAADTAIAGDGACTFREALANANGNADFSLGDCASGSGNDSIAFSIGGGGASATIALTSALPPVSDPVVINGNTQGCPSPPCVEIAGAATAAADGLSLAGGNSTLRGLVINGFDLDGIPVVSGGNFIEGNFVGTNLLGSFAVPNGSDGIDLNTTGAPNTIGGTVAAARNVVSGNLSDGIEIAPGPGTQVLGNYVGIAASGTLPLGNGFSGVIVGATSGCSVGSPAAGAGNVLSANAQSGVTFAAGASASLVQGNRVGTDPTGLGAIGNVLNGVFIRDSSGITVGGTAVGAGNVLSGNGGDGLQIDLDTGVATNNSILGNFIGTDATGTAPLGNANDGIEIERGVDSTVGGSTASARNVISANLRGVLLDDPGTTGNEILGNLIGTDIDGSASIGNVEHGVAIADGATDNSIGSADAGAGNLISGNGLDGVRVSSPSDDNRIQGNRIGTSSTGATALPNAGTGIRVTGDVSGTIIGGTTPGSGNVVAGNGTFGVLLINGPTTTQVLGNLVGTDASGTAALANGTSGMLIQDSANNTVGGTVAGARNVVSGNGQNGIFLGGPSGLSTSNQVLGNFIGTDITGTEPLPNTFSGVEIRDASGYTIGGAAAGEGNLIGTSSGKGIWINTDGIDPTSNNVIRGNLIGTDVTGSTLLGIPEEGIFVEGGSANTIGGSAVGDGNVIVGCGLDGIRLDQGTFNNTIRGNRIGTDITGTVLGNAGAGVRIANASSRNNVGGSAPGAGNVIAGSGEAGVVVLDTSDRNAILGNGVFANAGLGIDLADDGITANDGNDSDTGSNGLQNYPVLASATATFTDVTIAGNLTSKPNRGYRVELFAGTSCDPSGNGEGERYLGFTDVLTDGTGNAALNVVLAAAVGDGESITATATETNGPTSEFSACIAATCSSTAAFPQTLLAQNTETLVWSVPADVRFARGDLAAVSTYATNADGILADATSLDTSSDQPGPGAGSYYVVRPLACGSWQTAPGAEPDRDATLP